MFNAAVIGCGRIASTFDNDPRRRYAATHIGAYKRVPKIALKAVSDLDESRLGACVKKWSVPNGYRTVKELLNNEKIDILSVCTPPETHYKIIKEAVEFPLKAVFCEKPLAHTLEDAGKIVDICKSRNIILQVDHQRRFDPMHAAVRKIIETEKLGKAEQANFYYTAGIRNTGSHMFDLLRFFYGDADWIEGNYSPNLSHRTNDPNVDGVIKFKKGLFATFQSCDVKKYLIFEFNCLFEKGRIEIKNSGFSAEVYTSANSKNFSGYKELVKTKPSFKTDYRRNFMVNAVRHLIECAERRKPSISSGIDGLASLTMIEAALKSAKKDGKRIFIR